MTIVRADDVVNHAIADFFALHRVWIQPSTDACIKTVSFAVLSVLKRPLKFNAISEEKETFRVLTTGGFRVIHVISMNSDSFSSYGNILV